MNKPKVSTKAQECVLDLISTHCEPKIYHKETDIIYEGQTPIAGHCILNGEVLLLKRNKIFASLGNLEIFGIDELLSNAAFNFTARIKSGTTVYILDRSTVLELINKHCLSFSER